jgi:hypothetical protein
MRHAETAIDPGNPDNRGDDRQDDHLLPVMAFEFDFGFAGVWVGCAYLLVSELPYMASQLPSKAVSVLMQVKRHDLHGQQTRYFANKASIAIAPP